MSKLAALLNMLSSENDGERINSARLLTAMAKKENKTIADMVMSPQTIYRDRIVEKTVYRDRPASAQPKRETFDDDDLRSYRRTERPRGGTGRTRRGSGSSPILDGLRAAQDRPEVLTGWEMEFIESVLMSCMSDFDLSYRQERAAKKIIVKMDLYDDPLI